jgi:hypothetical protein
MKIRWIVAPLLCAAVAIAVVVMYSVVKQPSIFAQRDSLLAIARQYPNSTRAQRMAILREKELEMHPQWRDLSVSEIARRLLRLATTASTTALAPAAPFAGNLTSITSPSGTAVALVRQPNCTLSMGWASYTVSLPSATYTVPAPTVNYDQVLHSEAGLTTKGGVWPEGCVDATLGVPSRDIVPLGIITAGNLLVSAGAGYNAATGNQVIWTFAGTPMGSNTESVGDLTLSGSSPVGLAAGDLNGDGIADLVAVSESATLGGSGSVTVMLGKADGTFQSPVSYTLPGEFGLSVVIDDFNGDGKLDIVASSTSALSTTTATDSLTFLEGNGDGTFQAPQSVQVTPPAGFNGYTGAVPYFGLISTDLRGNGAKDLVTSGGIVLLGNGNGTFTQLSTVAFPTPTSTSQWGPDVIAADFNKDGKIDVAVSNGESIAIYSGNGDGTFTTGSSYASIANTGVLSEADLDGDGNVDLYSGTARGGIFGGDQFEHNQAYALLGNGNGTFQGAPEMPFVFNGTNLVNLNGDKVPDGVGLNVTSTSVSFTSYLGSSNGSFTTGPTLSVSPVMIQGTSYTVTAVNSFGFGDTTGGGNNDLVYLPQSFTGPNGQAGFFVATGNGNGSFNTPVFTPVVILPAGAPANDFDDTETLSNLFVADINGDGKADLVYNYSSVDYYLNTYIQGIAVQLSNGDGTFKAPQLIQTYSSTTIPPPLQPQIVQVAATRASGVPDLFVLLQTVSNGSVVTQLELYLGKGDGTFGAATLPSVAANINQPVGTGPTQIVLADMNGDGKPDLVTMGTSNDNYGEVAVSLGNGDGTFGTATITDFGGGSTYGYGMAVADFNGDGKMDVAVTGFNPPFDTGILLGNGDGTLQTFNAGNGIFEPAEGIDLLVFGPSLAVDFNGDGKPDLVAGSAVLLNLGTTTTLIPTTTAVSSSATSVAFGTSVTLTATVTATPTPTGTVTFYDGANSLGTGTLNASGVATYTAPSLSVGVHTITASYPASSTYAGSTSTAINVTVTANALIGTTSTLAASSTTVNSGASVTLTDTVVPASGATPTGTVNFLSGGVTLVSDVALSNGVATYMTSSLPVGANTIIAIYAGSSTNSGSTSNAVTVNVQTVPPTFTIGASPSSATVTAGQSTQTTITVTPAGGFNSQVGFACTGLPTGGTCSFNPTGVTPNGTAASTTTLTIATATQSGALQLPWRPGSRSGGAATLALMAAGALWIFGRRKNIPWMRMLPLLLALVTVAAVAIGCGGSGGGGGGGGGGTTPQTYTITVTGTSGTESQTATFTLTVG